jgi:HlyD family secretion protein
VVTALARLRPDDGIRRVAGPSRPSVVIAELMVREGDLVGTGQTLARLDTWGEHAAAVSRAKARVKSARTERDRVGALFAQGIAAVQLRDDKQLAVDVTQSELESAEAKLALDTVVAPVGGRVIAIRARAGERVTADGILEIAPTERMYAVADVYETDIGRVRTGQRARLRSAALQGDVEGTVESIGMRVQRLEAVDIDPAARTDARVVQVDIRLDDPSRTEALSNLQVEAFIEVGTP